jgi:chorismate dehydratase
VVPLKIAAVSYLNTFPFVYGIIRSGLLDDFTLELDIPSACAEKLKSGEADISLVPAGALHEMGDYEVVSGYCLGAVKEVRTVLLLSQKPLHEIRRIHLDGDSRTSVELVKILATHVWNIHPEFVNLTGNELSVYQGRESLVVIGDKTFSLRQHYPYVYDLAAEWIRFTGFPFVFAIWIAQRKLPTRRAAAFAKALEYGVNHIPESLEFFSERVPACDDCLSYLEQNISYILDEEKKKGLALFLNYLKK